MTRLPTRLLQTRLVASLPDLGQRHGAVEPVEDAQRQGDPLYNSPSEEPVEIKLHRISNNFLGLESVDHPHGHVADQQESDHLSAGLAAIVFRQVNSPARYISDEEHLKDHLGDRKQSRHHHQQIWLVREGCQGTSDHTEDGVDEETESGNTQEDVIEIALFLGLELETLHADEANDYGDDR